MNRRRVLVTLAGAALLMQSPPLLASDSMQVKTIQLDLAPEDEAVLLSAEFVVKLSEALKNAIERGLPLHFVTEYEIYRPRLLWFDEEAVKGQIEWRLSYHALTRQYRLSSAKGSESYPSLEDAMAQMVMLREWTVANAAQLKRDKEYVVRVRMRLDSARLPKPFQMTALTDSDWNPQSAWKGMSFVVPSRPIPAP